MRTAVRKEENKSPVFSIAAAYIVTAVVGIGGAAVLGAAGVAFLTSAVAVGLAVVTSRLINGGGGGTGGTYQDPGVRIQLPPATNNKIPVVYGSAYTKGTVTDARLSNENKTMTYVLQLCEKTDTGTFTVGDIFWNDSKLVFGTGADSHKVVSSIDQGGKGTTSTNYAGLIRVRVYAGDTNSGSQIFPTQASGSVINAKTILGESDVNYMLNQLVFAVVQIDYSSEKGITGLSQMTFQINNSLNNPGRVWYDYMTNTRYGAGIPVSQIDTNSSSESFVSTSLYNISNEIPSNQYESDGTTPSSQVRYQINGVLSTGNSVKTNIDKISMSCNVWTAYDYSQGKWKVIINRAALAGELTGAFVFNDDNIIGDIGITATNLDDLYNGLEVEFASREQRDQNDYYRSEISAGLRNDSEPDNILSLRLDMVNNALHASRVGLIEIKQSRVDLIITFQADYSALTVEAGDVVKITNDVYGFTDTLFRVTKTREVEDETGALTVEITALQYDADVYTDESLVDFLPTPPSGIPLFASSVTLPAPSAPVISNIFDTANVPNFTIATTIPVAAGPISLVEWFYSSSSTGPYIYLTNERSAIGNFGAGTTVTDVIFNLGTGSWYFKARISVGTTYSDFSAASAVHNWAPTPAGASGGVITSSTNIFINTAISGIYPLALASTTGNYSPVSGINNLTYDVGTNTLNVGGSALATKGITTTTSVSGSILPNAVLTLATGTITLTLPTSVGNNGSQYSVKNIGTGTITVDTVFGQLIQGDTTLIIEQQNSLVGFFSDGSDWWLF